MDMYRRLIFIITLCSHYGVFSALFTVQTLKSHYTAEYGGEISMECHFHVQEDMNVDDVVVYWEHIPEGGGRNEVINFFNGREIISDQHEDYKGRVKILKEELYKGHAVLQINNVELKDSGHYVCIISSDGSDYKTLTLKVQAHYKDINTSVMDIITTSGQRMKEITCHSLGYPEAQVTWLNEKANLSNVANTSYTVTADGMFNVTSVIRLSSVENSTFTCKFWNEAFREATSLTFTIPDECLSKRSYQLTLSVIAAFGVICILILIFIKIHGRSEEHVRKNSKCDIIQNKSLPVSCRSHLLTASLATSLKPNYTSEKCLMQDILPESNLTTYGPWLEKTEEEIN